MKNKIIIAIFVFIIAVFAGYLLLKNKIQRSSLLPTPEIPALSSPIFESPKPTTTQNIVTYTDSGYSPKTLRIKLGDVVVFQNNSARPMWPASDIHPTHQIYSGTSISEHCGKPIAQEAFDACASIAPGGFWVFTFNKPGSWNYHDHLNPVATGTVIVE